MKKLLLAMAMLSFSATANASADYTVTWQFGAPGFASAIKLDLDVGNDFISANGALILDTGAYVPVTGTCFLTLAGGIQCNVLIGQGDSGILDIGPSLNGEWRVINVNSVLVEVLPAILSEVK